MQEEFQSHISQRFNRDLEALIERLLEMGGLVEEQLARAVESLLQADTGLAKAVRSTEEKVNQLDIELDEDCTRLLALQQPAASDLRMTLAISRCITDLERVGDEASKIAKMTLQLAEDGDAPIGYVEVRHIAQRAANMLHDVLHAFVRQDVEQAVGVAERDELLDREYGSAMRTLVTYMMEDPRAIGQVLNILWVLRALERIGDHACNIAEQVLYLVKGRDMRHASTDEMEQLVQGGKTNA